MTGVLSRAVFDLCKLVPSTTGDGTVTGTSNLCLCTVLSPADTSRSWHSAEEVHVQTMVSKCSCAMCAMRAMHRRLVRFTYYLLQLLLGPGCGGTPSPSLGE